MQLCTGRNPSIHGILRSRVTNTQCKCRFLPPGCPQKSGTQATYMFAPTYAPCTSLPKAHAFLRIQLVQKRDYSVIGRGGQNYVKESSSTFVLSCFWTPKHWLWKRRNTHLYQLFCLSCGEFALGYSWTALLKSQTLWLSSVSSGNWRMLPCESKAVCKAVVRLCSASQAYGSCSCLFTLTSVGCNNLAFFPELSPSYLKYSLFEIFILLVTAPWSKSAPHCLHCEEWRDADGIVSLLLKPGSESMLQFSAFL